jgi:hypothetical protein
MTEQHELEMMGVRVMRSDIVKDIKDGKSIVVRLLRLLETYHALSAMGNKLAEAEGTQLVELLLEQRRESQNDELTEAEKAHVGLE